jgi:uncharacterized protein
VTSSNNGKPTYINPRVLKLNVGFILAEGPGFSRTVTLDIPEPVQVSEDLYIEDLTGELRLTRTREGVLLQGELECTRLAECTRCLTEVEVRAVLELEELFATREHETADTEFKVGEDANIDLAPLVRQETFLSTPIQILCDAACKGLCKHCGHNLNEGPCDCDPEEIDPRWAGLEALKRLSDNE